MENTEARAILRILVDAQSPEQIAVYLAEVLHGKGMDDKEVAGIFAAGAANAFVPKQVFTGVVPRDTRKQT